MIDREFAKKQILCLAQMERFPSPLTYPEALGKLVDALQTAPSEQYAKDVIDGFLEEATRDDRCPMPADIKNSILELLRKREGDILPDPECQKCNGAGSRLVRKGGEVIGASKCDCYARRHPPTFERKKFSEEEIAALDDFKSTMQSEIDALVEKKRGA